MNISSLFRTVKNLLPRRKVIMASFLALGLLLMLASAAYAAIINHKISGETRDDENISQFYYFSPDSKYVIYVSFRWSEGVFNLFSVPTRGYAPVQLNQTTVGGSVDLDNITPDSSTMIFIGDMESKDTDELFSVPINGGTQKK